MSESGTALRSQPQITVLDAGGQYCHLIARKVRELGVYAAVAPSDTPASELSRCKGLIISGGPASVYEAASPKIDPGILSGGAAVLGICYGQQLIADFLGGVVTAGEEGEYGLATLNVTHPGELLAGVPGRQQVWMSHRDLLSAPPPGFAVLASTPTCPIAAMENAARRLYGVQFHLEVVHTPHGRDILKRFVFDLCGCTPDWDSSHRVSGLEQQIRDTAGTRSVFFFVSGGVDSTVAYALCLRALGRERVRGYYVDTGLMREGETAAVRSLYSHLPESSLTVVDAASQFLAALDGACDPEEKRRIIGAEFVAVQENILRGGHLLDGQWIMGQGTIYPDTIESGGTAKADVIKTHHNRVAGIQDLLRGNRVVEPLSAFYKDEVRNIGRELGLPIRFLDRHPFPGPGLAIRCLCSAEPAPLTKTEDGWEVPVRTVGVQGDSRTYRPVLMIEGNELHQRATALTNRLRTVNRVVALIQTVEPIDRLSVFRAHLTPERIERLRFADAVVHRLSEESGFEDKVWQFPVILIPLGVAARPDSVVLRPVDSVDGMTAQSVPMDHDLLQRMTKELLGVDGVCGVFYDLTHKPPGTIEWE